MAFCFVGVACMHASALAAGATGGVWHGIFAEPAEGPDFEYLILDRTIVRVHQHADGAKATVLRSEHALKQAKVLVQTRRVGLPDRSAPR
jgi:hypothetical protein